ncbi:MAG: PIN domain-containing protein [Bacteroidales bacterium]|nr:PIN domain-containing protein [Bacteroidales bacterium]
MKVFLDTNVLLDYVCERQPFHADIKQVLILHEHNKIQCLVSALTIVNCAYIMRKMYKKDEVLRVIRWLCDKFVISNIDRLSIENAARKDYCDFEDAVQYFSALPNNPDVILTRDKQGFSDLGIIVMTPAEFVAKSHK